MHIPVLSEEVLEGLTIEPSGIYVDATAGLGGHSFAIAKRLESGKLYSCDRDAESLELARATCEEVAARIQFIHAPFSRLREALSGMEQAHGF